MKTERPRSARRKSACRTGPFDVVWKTNGKQEAAEAASANETGTERRSHAKA